MGSARLSAHTSDWPHRRAYHQIHRRYRRRYQPDHRFHRRSRHRIRHRSYPVHLVRRRCLHLDHPARPVHLFRAMHTMRESLVSVGVCVDRVQSLLLSVHLRACIRLTRSSELCRDDCSGRRHDHAYDCQQRPTKESRRGRHDHDEDASRLRSLRTRVCV